jgi:type IV pilus biogenesis protein CpaD/CtpE
MMDTFQWPVDHFHRLPEYYADEGLVDIEDHRKRPPRSVFRAFHEHWHAVIAQLLPIMAARDAEAGVEAQRLVLEVQRHAEEDGVFSAHTLRFILGRKM